jgi:hypothetical protein
VRVKWALAAVLVAVLTAPAAAQPVVAETPPGRWYGWQLVLADAAAVALVLAPMPVEAGPVARGVGMTALFMNGGIIHMAHGNPRSASISLLRVPALVVGRLLAVAAADVICSEVSCTHAAPLLGAAVGIAPVMLHDWVSARPPGRLFYAPSDPGPLVRRWGSDGWRLTVPVLTGIF